MIVQLIGCAVIGAFFAFVMPTAPWVRLPHKLAIILFCVGAGYAQIQHQRWQDEIRALTPPPIIEGRADCR